MPRGGARNNKPKALHLVQGTARAGRINDNEPEPAVVEDLKPPTGLDRYGKEAWKRNAPVLQRLGLLTEADVDALMAYCMAYSRWRRANIALRSVKPDAADEYRKVAVTVEKAEQSMRLFAGEFGMTPSSRSRLQVDTGEKSDPFEDWMSGGRRSS